MRRSRWLAPIGWAAFTELLTTWPRVPGVPSPAGADKVMHFLLYAVLAYLALRAARVAVPTARVALAVALSVAAWGALDEWHQRFINTRSADFADFLADSSGAIAGVAARLAVARRSAASHGAM